MNKGEWSEAYALIKLLSDGKLFLGDKDFEKVKGVFYSILKILKHENNKTLQFTYSDQNIVVEVEGMRHTIPLMEFKRMTLICLDAIKSSKGSFAIPDISNFFKSFNGSESAAGSNVKQDLTIQIEDPNTFLSPALGFSIKSQLGQSSTLFNASGVTNITYRLLGRDLTQAEIDDVNGTKYYSDKLNKIKEYGCEIIFDGIENEVFRTNLQTIDTYFEKILAEITLSYYKNYLPEKNTLVNFTDEVLLKNPLNYNTLLNPSIYTMMVKKFLVDFALGMRPGTVWQRVYEATGGYLVVRTDGEVLCYHFYFTQQFEDYLFNNTKLETPSASKHGFGKIYTQNNCQKIKLNPQVRFII